MDMSFRCGDCQMGGIDCRGVVHGKIAKEGSQGGADQMFLGNPQTSLLPQFANTFQKGHNQFVDQPDVTQLHVGLDQFGHQFIIFHINGKMLSLIHISEPTRPY